MAAVLDSSSDEVEPLAAEAGAADATRGDLLYAAILERIVAGDFEAGARLPSEIELARRFGVSRPLVREALARLRDHGLVQAKRGAGWFVRQRPQKAVLRFAPVDSIAGIQRCLEFRVAVEGRGAALAAERHDARSLARIEAAMAELERVIQTTHVGVEADFAFHVAVAAAARNDYFEQTIVMLADQVRVGMNVMRNLTLLKPAERLRLVQDEHQAVIDAIRRREPAAAEAAMARHIDNARRRMFEG